MAFYSSSGEIRINRFLKKIHGAGQWGPEELIDTATKIVERERWGRNDLQITGLELSCGGFTYTRSVQLLTAIGKVPPFRMLQRR